MEAGNQYSRPDKEIQQTKNNLNFNLRSILICSHLQAGSPSKIKSLLASLSPRTLDLLSFRNKRAICVFQAQMQQFKVPVASLILRFLDFHQILLPTNSRALQERSTLLRLRSSRTTSAMLAQELDDSKSGLQMKERRTEFAKH